eukprot:s213_g11.t1
MAKSHHINESESSRLRANQASFLDTISRTVVSGIRNGDYVVADLEDFKRNAERASIHQVKKIYSSPKEQWTFPMLAVYDKQTRSVCIDDPAMQTSAPKESERLDASDMLDMEDIVEILALDEQHWMTEDDIRAAREAELRAESSHGGGVDYWEHDLKSHRWTYHVVVPRKAMVRPSKTPGSIGEPPDPWKLSPVRVSHVQHKDKTPVTIYEDSYAFGKTRQLWTGRVEFFDGGHAPSKTTVSSYHGSDVLGGDSGLPYRQSVPRDERPYRGTKKPNSIDSASWRSMNRAEREGYVEAERREAEAKAMSREDTRDAAPADVEFDSAYDSPAEKHQKDYWLELVHRQGEVLSEFVQEKLAIAGEKFHDVVHEIEKKENQRRKKGTSNKQKTVQVATFGSTIVCSNLETAKGMEDALRKLTEINAQTLQGIQTLAEEIRTSAAASSQRETGLTQAFQDTIASVQQQQTQAQQALADAQTNAVTTFEEIGSSLEKAVKERKPGEVELHKLTFEEIGSSLEKAVKERKPGEVELHKLIKAPDAFNPGNWQEEKSGWTEFRSRMGQLTTP